MGTTIEAHLKYIGMTDADVQVLRELRGIAEENADAFVEKFYAHLLAFDGTRKFLTDDKIVGRLLRAQRAYLLSIFDAKFDDEYLKHRRIIGQTHFRIGLDFKWYIGAYVLYLDFFVPIFQLRFAKDAGRIQQVQSAYRKATLLDMSIVLEAYHEGDMAALESAQAQVLHQEKLAAVGLLASGLAHEIGNPLASIQAICDNQIRKLSDAPVVEKFTRIREQVTRITTIVRQLVGFARPSLANWTRVDIRQTIESSLAIARLSRSAKIVEVSVHVNDDVPQLEGIPDQLAQVFLNLFLNALDAMGEEGGELKVSGRLAEQRIHISITDNGCGMDVQQLKKIFTPFFTTKEVGKGTGLGLHVCEGIIKRHGGEIRVESESGKGSVFTVCLPLQRESAEGKSA